MDYPDGPGRDVDAIVRDLERTISSLTAMLEKSVTLDVWKITVLEFEKTIAALTTERDALREENGHRLSEIDRLRAVIKDDSEANSRERDMWWNGKVYRAMREKVAELELGWDSERDVAERLRKEMAGYDAMLAEEHSVRIQSEAERDALRLDLDVQIERTDRARANSIAAVNELHAEKSSIERELDALRAKVRDLEHDLELAEQGHANAH